MFKKIFIIVLALVLCMFVGSCGESDLKEETESNGQNDIYSTESDSLESNSNSNQDTSDVYIENEAPQIDFNKPEEKVITHIAIQGAIITKQDGSSMYKYKKKCEVCGHVDSGTTSQSNSMGTTKTSFTCFNCKNKQQVEIMHSSN